MHLQIINGPNLNLLGVREPSVYGHCGMDDFLVSLRQSYPDIKIDYYQSNIEGELINKIQEAGFTCDGILFNAGGYTHTSVALHDAIMAVKAPVVEIHISNVHRREEYRHTSLIASACKGIICGFGLNSYRLGVEAFLHDNE